MYWLVDEWNFHQGQTKRWLIRKHWDNRSILIWNGWSSTAFKGVNMNEHIDKKWISIVQGSKMLWCDAENDGRRHVCYWVWGFYSLRICDQQERQCIGQIKVKQVNLFVWCSLCWDACVHGMTLLVIEALAIKSMISKENLFETIGSGLNYFQCFVV